MRAKYDDIEVEVSDAYIEALHSIMASMMEMMRKAEPSRADCWVWGRARIEDLCSCYPVSFEYGSAEDKPDGLTTETGVTVLGSNKWR